MGYNIDRLKSQYGIGSASKLPYAGTPNPGTFAYSDDTNAANQAAELAAYNTQRADYLADQAAFDDYSDQFDQRLRNAPMYAQKQFDTSGRTAPLTRDDMYRKYLNRENELGGNQEVTAKDRQQFLRGAQQELANRGIDNLGSEYLLDDTGSYYGNVLDAPVYNYVAPLSPNVSEQLLPYGSGSQMGNRVINLPDGTPVTIPNTIIGPDGQVISTSTGFNIPSGLTAVPPNTPTYDALTMANANMAPIDIPNIAPINIPNIAPINIPNIAPINIPPVMDVPAANVPMTDLPPVASLPSGYDSYLSEPPLNQAIVSNAADFDISQYNVPEYITGPYGSIISPDLYERYLPDPVVTEEITYDSLIPEYDTSEYMTDFNQQIIPESFYGSYFAEGGEVETDLDVNLDGDPLDMNILVEETVSAEPLLTEGQQVIADLDVLEGMAIDNSKSDSRTDELITMLQGKTGQYDEQLSKERGQYNTATTDFRNMINKMADGQSKGPSESEKWFRLAAAFGKPTQSSSFFDSLGNASKALGDIASERREAKSSGDALEIQGAQFSLNLLKEQMENTSTLSALEKKENRATQKMLLEWKRESETLLEQRLYDLAVIRGEREYDATKPQSEAAKIAADRGLKGKARDDFITKFYEDKQAFKKLELKALTDNANQLGTYGMKAIDDIDGRLISSDEAIDLLVEALSVNEDAYANNFGDWSSKMLDLLTFNNESKEYKATQKLEILLKKVAAAALKVTFGGAGITDGEREALEKVQGLGVRDSDLRGEIIKDGIAAMRSVQQKYKAKRKAILNRTAYKIQPEEE